IVAMDPLYRRSTPETLTETIKQVSRLATVDMRVDYLAPGRGKYFIARAEVLRLGRKGCTMRMTMVNDEDKAIAAGIASYAY
ncbi:hotdog domain-containing protein, partial [Acinetobacter baumannii]